MEKIITFTGVNKYFGKNHILSNINLEIDKGSIVAILGSSGSGKSTLVRCINRLERFQRGSILVNDILIEPYRVMRGNKELNSAEIANFRTGIGMVFQNFNLFQHMNVIKNLIEAPMGVLGWTYEKALLRARELLEQVGLSEKEQSYPYQLSGGQQQRVAIIRSLMMDPEIILFDEPTSALDPELTIEVLNTIKNLALSGRTALIVTHEISFARDVATHVLVLDQGSVVEFDKAKLVFCNPKSERTKIFLDLKK